jgi:hypothetical protein
MITANDGGNTLEWEYWVGYFAKGKEPIIKSI